MSLTHEVSETSPTPASLASLREATRVWVEVALNSFGGPAGQIAVMHLRSSRWSRALRSSASGRG